jgi:hypothetical protein
VVAFVKLPVTSMRQTQPGKGRGAPKPQPGSHHSCSSRLSGIYASTQGCGQNPAPVKLGVATVSPAPNGILKHLKSRDGAVFLQEQWELVFSGNVAPGSSPLNPHRVKTQSDRQTDVGKTSRGQRVKTDTQRWVLRGRWQILYPEVLSEISTGNFQTEKVPAKPMGWASADTVPRSSSMVFTEGSPEQEGAHLPIASGLFETPPSQVLHRIYPRRLPCGLQ